MKIAFISNHPAPYRDEFLARFVKVQGLDVRVFSLYPNDTGHAFWNLKKPEYDAEVLGQYDEPNGRVLWRLLRKFVFASRYDLVVWPGFFCAYLLVPILLCAILGKKYAYMADSVRQPKISKLGFAIKRFIARHAAFVFVPGEASVRFFHETFGLPRERIVKGAYALDGRALESKVNKYRESRWSLRAEYGIPDGDKVFLMVANMIPTRHYPITASAFVAFAARHPHVKFIMVGNGPENEKMRAVALKHPCLKVVDGCSFEEMLKLYGLADVYVHGGIEPASTALVIGAISGLPLVSSPAVGCYYDVVLDGETGVAVKDYLSVDEWTEAFDRIVALEPKWREFGKKARGCSRILDVEESVENMVKIVKNIDEEK